jgi:hypothetical protein
VAFKETADFFIALCALGIEKLLLLLEFSANTDLPPLGFFWSLSSIVKNIKYDSCHISLHKHWVMEVTIA